MTSVDVTHFLAPYRERRVRRPVRLALTEHTYPPDSSPKRSWIPLAFRAFSRLAEARQVRDLLIIGTGNGLDALGAIEIFNLDSLTATYLVEESLSVARENILSHLEDRGEIELGFHAGDLLSCVPPEKRFCVIYENLPSLRAPGNVQLEAGTNSGRFFDPAEPSVPEPFNTYLLALHYRCLQEAQGFVREGGGVLTALGGRIPREIAFDLHRACGYLPELVTFDLKIQGEPHVILPAYCRAEEESGAEFTFYLPEALDVVAEARRAGLEGERLADAVEDRLLSRTMSAHEAMERYRRGDPVAHSVFMIFGERRARDHRSPRTPCASS